MKRVKIFTDTAIDTISVERLLEKVYLEYMTDIEDAVVRCAAGMTIPEAPEPPEGYEWHPYPDVMPDHDMDIVPNPVRG